MNRFILLLSLWLSTPLFAQTLDVQCRTTLQSKPSFSIESKPISTLTVRTPASVLRQQHQADPSSHILGLTSTQWNIQHSIRLEGFSDSMGIRSCVKPHVHLIYEYQPMLVQIAQELGSPLDCPYRTILEHEEQHVRIYRQFLTQTRKTLESALLRQSWMHGVWIETPFRQAYLDRLDRNLSDLLDRHISIHQPQLDELHHQFDRHDMQRISKPSICNGFFSQLQREDPSSFSSKN